MSEKRESRVEFEIEQASLDGCVIGAKACISKRSLIEKKKTKTSREELLVSFLSSILKGVLGFPECRDQCFEEEYLSLFSEIILKRAKFPQEAVQVVFRILSVACSDTVALSGYASFLMSSQQKQMLWPVGLLTNVMQCCTHPFYGLDALIALMYMLYNSHCCLQLRQECSLCDLIALSHGPSLALSPSLSSAFVGREKDLKETSEIATQILEKIILEGGAEITQFMSREELCLLSIAGSFVVKIACFCALNQLLSDVALPSFHILYSHSLTLAAGVRFRCGSAQVISAVAFLYDCSYIYIFDSSGVNAKMLYKIGLKDTYIQIRGDQMTNTSDNRIRLFIPGNIPVLLTFADSNDAAEWMNALSFLPPYDKHKYSMQYSCVNTSVYLNLRYSGSASLCDDQEILKVVALSLTQDVVIPEYTLSICRLLFAISTTKSGTDFLIASRVIDTMIHLLKICDTKYIEKKKEGISYIHLVDIPPEELSVSIRSCILFALQNMCRFDTAINYLNETVPAFVVVLLQVAQFVEMRHVANTPLAILVSLVGRLRKNVAAHRTSVMSLIPMVKDLFTLLQSDLPASSYYRSIMNVALLLTDLSRFGLEVVAAVTAANGFELLFSFLTNTNIKLNDIRICTLQAINHLYGIVEGGASCLSLSQLFRACELESSYAVLECSKELIKRVQDILANERMISDSVLHMMPQPPPHSGSIGGRSASTSTAIPNMSNPYMDLLQSSGHGGNSQVFPDEFAWRQYVFINNKENMFSESEQCIQSNNLTLLNARAQYFMALLSSRSDSCIQVLTQLRSSQLSIVGSSLSHAPAPAGPSSPSSVSLSVNTSQSGGSSPAPSPHVVTSPPSQAGRYAPSRPPPPTPKSSIEQLRKDMMNKQSSNQHLLGTGGSDGGRGGNERSNEKAGEMSVSERIARENELLDDFIVCSNEVRVLKQVFELATDKGYMRGDTTMNQRILYNIACILLLYSTHAFLCQILWDNGVVESLVLALRLGSSIGDSNAYSVAAALLQFVSTFHGNMNSFWRLGSSVPAISSTPSAPSTESGRPSIPASLPSSIKPPIPSKLPTPAIIMKGSTQGSQPPPITVPAPLSLAPPPPLSIPNKIDTSYRSTVASGTPSNRSTLSLFGRSMSNASLTSSPSSQSSMIPPSSPALSQGVSTAGIQSPSTSSSRTASSSISAPASAPAPASSNSSDSIAILQILLSALDDPSFSQDSRGLIAMVLAFLLKNPILVPAFVQCNGVSSLNDLLVGNNSLALDGAAYAIGVLAQYPDNQVAIIRDNPAIFNTLTHPLPNQPEFSILARLFCLQSFVLSGKGKSIVFSNARGILDDIISLASGQVVTKTSAIQVSPSVCYRACLVILNLFACSSEVDSVSLTHVLTNDQLIALMKLKIPVLQPLLAKLFAYRLHSSFPPARDFCYAPINTVLVEYKSHGRRGVWVETTAVLECDRLLLFRLNSPTCTKSLKLTGAIMEDNPSEAPTYGIKLISPSDPSSYELLRFNNDKEYFEWKLYLKHAVIGEIPLSAYQRDPRNVDKFKDANGREYDIDYTNIRSIYQPTDVKVWNFGQEFPSAIVTDSLIVMILDLLKSSPDLHLCYHFTRALSDIVTSGIPRLNYAIYYDIMSVSCQLLLSVESDKYFAYDTSLFEEFSRHHLSSCWVCSVCYEPNVNAFAVCEYCGEPRVSVLECGQCIEEWREKRMIYAVKKSIVRILVALTTNKELCNLMKENSANNLLQLMRWDNVRDSIMICCIFTNVIGKSNQLQDFVQSSGVLLFDTINMAITCPTPPRILAYLIYHISILLTMLCTRYPNIHRYLACHGGIELSVTLLETASRVQQVKQGVVKMVENLWGKEKYLDECSATQLITLFLADFDRPKVKYSSLLAMHNIVTKQSKDDERVTTILDYVVPRLLEVLWPMTEYSKCVDIDHLDDPNVTACYVCILDIVAKLSIVTTNRPRLHSYNLQTLLSRLIGSSWVQPNVRIAATTCLEKLVYGDSNAINKLVSRHTLVIRRVYMLIREVAERDDTHSPTTSSMATQAVSSSGGGASAVTDFLDQRSTIELQKSVYIAAFSLFSILTENSIAQYSIVRGNIVFSIIKALSLNDEVLSNRVLCVLRRLLVPRSRALYSAEGQSYDSSELVNAMCQYLSAISSGSPDVVSALMDCLTMLASSGERKLLILKRLEKDNLLKIFVNTMGIEYSPYRKQGAALFNVLIAANRDGIDLTEVVRLSTLADMLQVKDSYVRWWAAEIIHTRFTRGYLPSSVVVAKEAIIDNIQYKEKDNKWKSAKMLCCKDSLYLYRSGRESSPLHKVIFLRCSLKLIDDQTFAFTDDISNEDFITIRSSTKALFAQVTSSIRNQIELLSCQLPHSPLHTSPSSSPITPVPITESLAIEVVPAILNSSSVPCITASSVLELVPILSKCTEDSNMDLTITLSRIYTQLNQITPTVEVAKLADTLSLKCGNSSHRWTLKRLPPPPIPPVPNQM